MTATALRPSGRPDLRLGGVLLVVAAGAWALTADRMAGMDAGPSGELGGVGWFAVSWLVMMAAMMLPAVAPMVVAYGRRAGPVGPAALFVGGYLGTWLAAGLVAYAAIDAIRSLQIGFLAWDEGGRYVAAGVIAGAGLYQLTASKNACLRRCRDRSTPFRQQRRRGPLSAVRRGIEHGGICVGCCWALMAALFALGVMSMAWMAVVAVLIAAERLLGGPSRLGVALVLVALGVCVAVAPEQLPALTLPASGPMHGMPMP